LFDGFDVGFFAGFKIGLTQGKLADESIKSSFFLSSKYFGEWSVFPGVLPPLILCARVIISDAKSARSKARFSISRFL